MTSRPASEEEAHDILAAEAFAVPAPDPALRQLDEGGLPADPSGIAQPHDVLAADEFAIPTTAARASNGPAGVGSRSKLGAAATAAAGLLGALLLRRRRYRSR